MSIGCWCSFFFFSFLCRIFHQIVGKSCAFCLAENAILFWPAQCSEYIQEEPTSKPKYFKYGLKIQHKTQATHRLWFAIAVVAYAIHQQPHYPMHGPGCDKPSETFCILFKSIHSTQRIHIYKCSRCHTYVYALIKIFHLTNKGNDNGTTPNWTKQIHVNRIEGEREREKLCMWSETDRGWW